MNVFAGFFFVSPLKAAFCVGDTASKTTGGLVNSSNALALCFLAYLGVGAVGYAPGIFAFFVFFADLESFAIPPGVVAFAGLCPCATALSVRCFALPRRTWLADFASPSETDRLGGVFEFAVFVGKTIHATPFPFAE